MIKKYQNVQLLKDGERIIIIKYHILRYLAFTAITYS